MDLCKGKSGPSYPWVCGVCARKSSCLHRTALRPATAGRMCRLEADHGGRGLPVASLLPAGGLAQSVVQGLECPVLASAVQLGVDGLPGREVARQHAPRALWADEVEDRLRHDPTWPFQGTPCRSGRRSSGSNVAHSESIRSDGWGIRRGEFQRVCRIDALRLSTATLPIVRRTPDFPHRYPETSGQCGKNAKRFGIRAPSVPLRTRDLPAPRSDKGGSAEIKYAC